MKALSLIAAVSVLVLGLGACSSQSANDTDDATNAAVAALRAEIDWEAEDVNRKVIELIASGVSRTAIEKRIPTLRKSRAPGSREGIDLRVSVVVDSIDTQRAEVYVGHVSMHGYTSAVAVKYVVVKRGRVWIVESREVVAVS